MVVIFLDSGLRRNDENPEIRFKSMPFSSMGSYFSEENPMHDGRHLSLRQPAADTPLAESKRHDPLTDCGNQSLDVHD